MGIPRTKIGDIFEVPLHDGTKCYFQFIAIDFTLLDGDTLRVFKRRYSQDESPSIETILDDEVSFYTHVFMRKGLKQNLWIKYGHSDELGDLSKAIFKNWNDFYNWWNYWVVNGPFMKSIRLPKKFANADVGVLVQPSDLIRKIETGYYLKSELF
ncbi:MAG: immunity 26/phosphotriesterase HocA family protein [Bacteroidales bacterium]|nr:immunity 26/phosphotriesterase HocA family protein [Bacteroidales bacterium]